jgi:hypothetical protein
MDERLTLAIGAAMLVLLFAATWLFVVMQHWPFYDGPRDGHAGSRRVRDGSSELSLAPILEP